MYSVLTVLGSVLSHLHNYRSSYETKKITSKLGGGDRIVQYPFHISGMANMEVGQSVNIGRNAMIMTTRAKFIIKGHFISGPGLTVVTGDHMASVGKFIDDVNDKDKDLYDVDHVYDQDVIIEEDVWCGANVTILKGVKIGRGSIIAAGAVVTKSIPPYSIAGGVPARVIKTRWTKQQILDHERVLYNEAERLSDEQIERFNV